MAAFAMWCRFHASIVFPELKREIDLESLQILQEDSGTQAKLLFFLKAKRNGWCNEVVMPAQRTLFCRGALQDEVCFSLWVLQRLLLHRQLRPLATQLTLGT